jgi:hypothetical protein
MQQFLTVLNQRHQLRLHQPPHQFAAPQLKLLLT